MVDFYIVEQAGDTACDLLACRLIEKAWRQGYRLHVRVSDDDAVHRLDRLLWTYRQGAFLPHAPLDLADQNDPVVIAGPDTPPRADDDVLVNLAPTPPAPGQQLGRIAEFANQDPESLQAARERFRWYRSQGIEPTTHRIGGEQTP